MINLRETFGDIDIYLFDQIQKARFAPGMKVLDAGCGGGRNIVWLLQNGFDVSAIDIDQRSVEYVRELAKRLAPNLAPENFEIATLDSIPFPEQSFDRVICNAVLHFAEDQPSLTAGCRTWLCSAPAVFRRLDRPSA
ncbi:MAG: class I SAM-dependent methyltransferase [Chloracidobacterium sp.]|nr:class I SAM-dependent methyltransferase [Chloracidobacterium sp.]